MGAELNVLDKNETLKTHSSHQKHVCEEASGSVKCLRNLKALSATPKIGNIKLEKLGMQILFTLATGHCFGH